MTAGGPARPILLPLTPLYRFALALRERRLRSGREPIRRLQFPVISIGNLSTGGAGKTPFAIALVRALDGAGFAVDVLSRGFGRSATAPARVPPDGSAAEFGDEPLLIAREANVPVYVASQRYEAGLLAESSQQAIVQKNEPVILSGAGRMTGAVEGSAFQNASLHHSIHILDDAFQHRQLHRDIDILLINRDDWHDRLLPAGNLREPRRAALRASVIAIPASDLELEAALRSWSWEGPIWRLHRRMEVPPVNGPVLAFCGIARPGQFFAGLEAAGLRLARRVTFRDHHSYIARDLDHLRDAARGTGASALVTTEKDQVRLAPLHAALPPDLPLLTVGLRIEIEQESAALGWLVDRLKSIPPRPPL
jgi:tetraacyldisaccharide 4'-kinase